jgi:hypothetical protein
LDRLVSGHVNLFLFAFSNKEILWQGYFLSFFKTCVATFVYITFVIPIAIGVMIAGAFLFY